MGVVVGAVVVVNRGGDGGGSRCCCRPVFVTTGHVPGDEAVSLLCCYNQRSTPSEGIAIALQGYLVEASYTSGKTAQSICTHHASTSKPGGGTNGDTITELDDIRCSRRRKRSKTRQILHRRVEHS